MRATITRGGGGARDRDRCISEVALQRRAAETHPRRIGRVGPKTSGPPQYPQMRALRMTIYPHDRDCTYAGPSPAEIKSVGIVYEECMRSKRFSRGSIYRAEWAIGERGPDNIAGGPIRIMHLAFCMDTTGIYVHRSLREHSSRDCTRSHYTIL